MQPFIYKKCIVFVILYVYVLTTTKTRLGNLNQKNSSAEDLLIIKKWWLNLGHVLPVVREGRLRGCVVGE